MGEVMAGQVEANNRLQRTALRAAAEPERYMLWQMGKEAQGLADATAGKEYP